MSKAVIVSRRPEQLEQLYRRRVAARLGHLHWRSLLRRHRYDRLCAMREAMRLDASRVAMPFALYERDGRRISERDFFAALNRAREWLQRIARGDGAAIGAELSARKARPDPCALGRELDHLLRQSEKLWSRLKRCEWCDHVFVDRAAGLTKWCGPPCRQEAHRMRAQLDPTQVQFVKRSLQFRKQNGGSVDAAMIAARREVQLTDHDAKTAWQWWMRKKRA